MKRDLSPEALEFVKQFNEASTDPALRIDPMKAILDMPDDIP